MKNEDVMKRADTVIAKTYDRFSVAMTEGKGCVLKDAEGNTYLDFVAGIAVCNLGHANETVAKAVSEQARRLVHVSNLYYTEPQVALAELLVQHSFADRVFFGNSGAEANEAAIKLARKYFKDKGEPDRYRIITMEGSFHGRTMATLSATGQDKIKKGFAPLLDGFDIVRYEDLQAVENAMNEQTCAVMLEPIQGEGGVRVPKAGYLEGLREICDAHGLLVIFDEVQTGMGRTGRLFGYEYSDMTPDIMTLAKALGNGLPIGAMLAKEEVAEAFSPGAHASTFGGTPLVSAAAVAVIKTMLEEGVVDHCRSIGRYFADRLARLKEKHNIVRDVRGRGLLLGMELACEGAPIVAACQKEGFLINCTQGNVLRFVPPLVIQKEEIDSLMVCLDSILAAVDDK